MTVSAIWVPEARKASAPSVPVVGTSQGPTGPTGPNGGGFSGTIITAKIAGATGSMTFVNGILVSQVQAT